MLKKVFYSAACSLTLLCFAEDTENAGTSDVLAQIENGGEKEKDNETHINIKAVHERCNEKFWGKDNTSAVALNPVLRLGKNLILEGDCHYGRQFKFSGYLKGPRSWSEITGNKSAFYDEFTTLAGPLNASSKEGTQKGRFFRNYTRLVYRNTDNDFRIVAGDTTTHNTVGFQKALSGLGISIFRQGGDFSTINVGSPIVITKLSKVECRLNNEIISIQLLRPGVYSLNDLPEEAKLPGVLVKITDQLSRSEVLTTDYFACYGKPETGKNDWDLSVIWPGRWDLDDPYKTKYRNKPRCSTNYRYGYSDLLTVGVGGQIYENSHSLDATVIISGNFGVVSPNIGYSRVHGNGKSKQAVGVGVFYAIPKNKTGLHLETSFSYKGKGYGDLGIGADVEKDYNDLIEKCFNTDALRRKYKNSGPGSNYKQVVVRAYSDPIFGVVPAFTFNGEWEDRIENEYSGNRLREYTLSFNTKIGCFSWVLAGGLTYDDPSKGRNQRSPDRRFTLACTVNVNSEIEIQGNYVYYNDDKRKGYSCVTYTPEAIKGLELCQEFTTRPGVRDQSFSAKYDHRFFAIKVEENMTNTYEDKEAKTRDSHDNEQRITFSTGISAKGLCRHKNNGINILRD